MKSTEIFSVLFFCLHFIFLCLLSTSPVRSPEYMFANVLSPDIPLKEELDALLAKGWFRMGQSVFTTSFLSFKNQYYSAIWLRTDLKSNLEDNNWKKLNKQNSKFQVEIREAFVSAEKEQLFSLYRNAVAFDASESVHQLLYSKTTGPGSIFNTWEICLYDGELLVAVGIFDQGANSAEGISCFYHPDFKKYSLGKYLIYLKIQYCQKLGFRYFYPGYFVPGYAAFDYKLSIAKDSLWYFSLMGQQWKPISSFSIEENQLIIMEQRLSDLLELLNLGKIRYKIFYYEYFQANMVPELSRFELFDFPVFLYEADCSDEFLGKIIVFNIFSGKYELLKCRTVWKTYENEVKENIFSEHLLKTERVLFTSQYEKKIFALLSNPEIFFKQSNG